MGTLSKKVGRDLMVGCFVAGALLAVVLGCLSYAIYSFAQWALSG